MLADDSAIVVTAQGIGTAYNAGVKRLSVAAVLCVLAGACRGTAQPEQRPPSEEVVVWKSLGEWSGRGNSQTESFIGLTGALRVHWRTKNEARAGAGRFRIVLQSAISGRDLQEVVDEMGQGEDTAYVADDPRVFQISVASADVDWWFTVEEAVFGSPATKRPGPSPPRGGS